MYIVVAYEKEIIFSTYLFLNSIQKPLTYNYVIKTYK
jgi:hypothetical protein